MFLIIVRIFRTYIFLEHLMKINAPSEASS